MIKGHNPNRMQKKMLSAAGYEWTEWLVLKVYADKIVFRHKTTDQEITLDIF